MVNGDFVPTTGRKPPATASTSAMLDSRNTMMLGVFCLNVSGGMMMSEAVPNTLSWPDVVDVARLVDDAGWEFLLSLGAWRGKGGRFNANAEQYEVFTWSAAVAAVTRRVHLFTTVHVPIYHPYLVARMVATIDAVSAGRAGLNILAGYNEREFRMFGIKQLDHEARYQAAAEWLDAIEALWATEGEVDFAGSYYQMSGACADPKPVQARPLLIAAGSSPSGLDFALRRCDFTFQGGPSFDFLDGVRSRTDARARELGVTSQAITFAPVFLADTEREARRYYEWVVDEMGDGDAARAQIERSIAGGGRSIDPDIHRAAVRSKISGFGGRPLIGTPEQVVEQLLEYHRLGYRGIGLGWVDTYAGAGEFVEKVVPLMVEAGLRG